MHSNGISIPFRFFIRGSKNILHFQLENANELP